MAAGIIGTVGEFNPDQESMTTYLERMELYFAANEIKDGTQVAAFLTMIGRETYKRLVDLFAPEKPATKTLKEITDKLKEHFEPLKVEIAERYNFYQRNQLPGESVTEFLAELRRLSIHCGFGTFLNQALRDKLVCGLLDEGTKKKLLAEKNLDLKNAVQIAQGMEAAEKNTKLLRGNDSQPIQMIRRQRKDVQRGVPATACYRCGGFHGSSDCRFKDAVCHYCKKRGHIARVCRARGKRRDGGKVQVIDEDEVDDADSEPLVIKAVEEENSKRLSGKPITIAVVVNDRELTMELDTGAAVSIMSEQTLQRLFPQAPLKQTRVLLRTYSGEPLKVLGELRAEVRYGKQCCTLPLLVVSGTGPTLLGRDWLKHIQLDWKSIGLTKLDGGSVRVQELLQRYREVFGEDLGLMKHFQAKLHVKEGTRPVFLKPRSVPYALKEPISRELDRLESQGVLEKVNYSEWAAPIVPVPKADGQIRICGDYKVTVNPALQIDQYPLPKLDDLFASLAGGERFSKIDLTRAYQQMALNPDSRTYVTITTHQGLYQYTRLPFGIASAPALFQRTMDSILQGIPHVQCYIDDILVTGQNDDEHIANLEEVLKRLQKHGVKINRKKCSFLQDSVEYLGHRIDKEGLHTIPNKIEAIQKAPKPGNKKQLRSFLRLVQYYSRFIPNLATLLSPLNRLLRHDIKWEWSAECEEAFQQAKQKLVSTPVLAHFDLNLPVRLAADASAYGIGAVISHEFPDGSEHPIAYASRTLTPAERNYAQLEKEALALVFGVSKFHQYLYGKPFTLITDHKPLLFILGPKTGIPQLAAARLQRWALALAAYRYKIEFRPTDKHSNADGLSRLPVSSNSTSQSTSLPIYYFCNSSMCFFPQGVDDADDVDDVEIFPIRQIEALPLTSDKLRTATRNDSVLGRVLRLIQKGWPSTCPSEDLKPYYSRSTELSVVHGCIMWGVRVIVPKKLQPQVLLELHQGHPGIVRMKSLSRSHVWWPKLNEEIEKLAKLCKHCQENRANPPSAPLHPWLWPSRPWERIHVDFAGPVRGRQFLILVDAHSKWADAIEMSSTTSAATIRKLRGLFASYGLPVQLVSDNGPQFASDEFSSFLKSNGVKHITSAPYHPSSNGLAERFVKTFKKAMKNPDHPSASFDQQLMSFLLSYRTTPHCTTGETPVSLFLLRSVRTRLDLMYPEVKDTVMKKQAEQKDYHDQHAHMRQFDIGQRVLARNYRPGDKWLTGTILDKLGPLSYRVQVGSRLWRRHVDQLLGVPDCPFDFHSGDNQTEESVDPPEPLCSGDRESPQTVPPFPSPPVMPHDPSTAAAIPLTPTPDNNDLTDSIIPVPLPVSQPDVTIVPERRYPLRIRKRTDFYSPGRKL